MAVRHGYGKVVTDGLVFAYDTGDTVNSYLGKPVTNLATAIQSRGGDVVADPTDLPDLPKHIAPKVYCSSKIVESTNSWQSLFQYNTAISVADGERFVVTAWVYVPEGKTNNRFNINCSVGSSNTGLTQSPSHDIPTGRWVKLLGRYTNNTGAAVSITSTRLETYTAAEWTGNITCWAANFMIEKGSDLVSGYRGSQSIGLGDTRSATEGLKDLTGNRSIDLANVSFDSSAQMTFDGSNDYLSFPYTQTTPNIFSVEAIFYHTAHSSDTNIGHILVMPYSGYNAWIFSLNGTNSKLQLRHHNYETSSTSYNVAYTTGLSLNKWYHVLATDDGTNVKLYVDGDLVKSQASATSTTNGTMTCKVGSWPTLNTSFAGDIPVVKIYSRTLTAGEVKQNFAMYKKRFNI